MALSSTNRKSIGNNTSNTSIDITPTANFSAQNSMAVYFASFNNSVAGGSNPFSSISDSLNNTWTVRENFLWNPGGTNLGYVILIATTNQNAGLITTGTTITLSFTTNTAARKIQLFELSAASGKKPDFVSASHTFNSGGGVASITASTVNSGEIIYGIGNRMTAEQPSAYDTDTTKGSWSSQTLITSPGIFFTQSKVTTGTGSQTYNFTTTNNGNSGVGYSIFKEIDIPKTRNYYFFLE